jgi:hypothetical protein
MFFDRHLSRAQSDFLTGSLKYTRSFVRADGGDAATQVAIGSYQDYDTANNSQDYFYYKDGSTMVRTNVECTVGWHNFQFDYSNPGTVDLYIDGTKIASLSRPSFKYISMSGLAGHNDNYIDQVYVYGGVAVTPNVAPSLPISGDIAPSATVTASSSNSSYPASNAIDNNVRTEWASNGETNPWIQLNWSSSQNINKITFYDRQNLMDWAPGGTLTFSDGSTVPVSGIPNNGNAYTITFPNKTVTWVKFQVSGGSGSNVGLAEMAVFNTVFRQMDTQIEAESCDSSYGVGTESCSEGGLNLKNINNGYWTAYNLVNFGTGATSFNARVASANSSGGTIELRLDSTSGTLIGTCTVPGTGGWQNWTTVNCNVSGATGVHNLYLVYKGGSGALFNLNWFKFITGTLSQIEAESYNNQSGIQTESCSEGGLDVGYINNGDWTEYNNVDFGSGAATFSARVASAASAASGGNIELRLDSPTGTLVGTCAVSGTGGWQNWSTVSCNVSGATGVHNLYLVYKGGSGYLFNFNWFKFN